MYSIKKFKTSCVSSILLYPWNFDPIKDLEIPCKCLGEILSIMTVLYTRHQCAPSSLKRSLSVTKLDGEDTLLEWEIIDYLSSYFTANYHVVKIRNTDKKCLRILLQTILKLLVLILRFGKLTQNWYVWKKW